MITGIELKESQFARINRGIEKALYERGFYAPQIRALVRYQVYVAGVSFLTLCLLPFVGNWPLVFVAGVLLATYNFYAMAKFVQQIVTTKFTKGMLVSLLARVYGRLLLTGVALFVLIVWVKASLVALLAGLTTVVATILVWAGLQIIHVKEA